MKPARIAPLLAMLAALTPFAIDTYLPALPAMATYFGAPISLIQASLSSYLFGFAIGQIVGGPISDRIGRRPVGLAGLATFIAASLLIVLCRDAYELLALRFVQAAGGGCLSVIATSVVRDLFEGKDSARVFALVMLMMGVAPLVAPAVGAAMTEIWGWQSIFIGLAAYATLLALLVARVLPETAHRQRILSGAPMLRTPVLHTYFNIIRHGKAAGYLLASSFSLSVLFIFLTNSSFAYMQYFGVSTTLFPLLIGANVISLMIFNRLNVPFLKRFDSPQIVLIGITLQVLAALLLLAYVVFAKPELVIIVSLVVFTIGCSGLIGPNCTSAYLAFFPDTTGSASAVIGTLRFAFSAVLGGLATGLHDGTLAPVAGIMAASSVAALVCLLCFSSKSGGPPLMQTSIQD